MGGFVVVVMDGVGWRVRSSSSSLVVVTLLLACCQLLGSCVACCVCCVCCVRLVGLPVRCVALRCVVLVVDHIWLTSRTIPFGFDWSARRRNPNFWINVLYAAFLLFLFVVAGAQCSAREA